MIDIKKFGKHLKVEESNLSKKDREKEIFISIIELLDDALERSAFIKEELGIDLMGYEQNLFTVAENLIFLKYGEIKLDVIAWYLYGNIEEPVTLEEAGKPAKEIYIKTAEDLWNFLLMFKIKEDEE